MNCCSLWCFLFLKSFFRTFSEYIWAESSLVPCLFMLSTSLVLLQAFPSLYIWHSSYWIGSCWSIERIKGHIYPNRWNWFASRIFSLVFHTDLLIFTYYFVSAVYYDIENSFGSLAPHVVQVNFPVLLLLYLKFSYFVAIETCFLLPSEWFWVPCFVELNFSKGS